MIVDHLASPAVAGFACPRSGVKARAVDAVTVPTEQSRTRRGPDPRLAPGPMVAVAVVAGPIGVLAGRRRDGLPLWVSCSGALRTRRGDSQCLHDRKRCSCASHPPDALSKLCPSSSHAMRRVGTRAGVTGRDRLTSGTVTRSAVLRVRLAVLYEVVHETLQTSHDLCDNARATQDRARRTASRER